MAEPPALEPQQDSVVPYRYQQHRLQRNDENPMPSPNDDSDNDIDEYIQSQLKRRQNQFYLTTQQMSAKGCIIPIGTIGKVISSTTKIGSYAVKFAAPFNDTEYFDVSTNLLSFS